MMTRPRNVTLIFVAWLIHMSAWSAPVEAWGEYMYGPETSDAQACRLAVLAAKNNALSRIVGEDVSVDQSYACSEKMGPEEMQPTKGLCTLNKYLWSQMSGEIQSFKVMETSIATAMGARICKARISAVIKHKPASEPELDFAVTINASTLRVGEKLKMSVTADQPAHLYVFSWVPALANDGVVETVFPNPYQNNAFLNARLTIPNQDYDIVVGSSSKDTERSQAPVQLEHLIFVMSKKELHWPQKMGYDDFSQKVFSSDSQQVRIRKKTLSVVAN